MSFTLIPVCKCQYKSGIVLNLEPGCLKVGDTVVSSLVGSAMVPMILINISSSNLFDQPRAITDLMKRTGWLPVNPKWLIPVKYEEFECFEVNG